MIEQLEISKLSLSTKRKALRVAHILSGSQVWGVETYVYNLLTSMESNHLNSLIICTNEGAISKKFRDSGFNVVLLPIKGYFDGTAIQNLRSILELKQIDLLHVHLGLDSFVGALAAKLAHVPVVMSVHFDHPNWINYGFLQRTIWRQFQRLKNSFISHFLPITDNVGSELTERESVSKDKITVIHPGIPLFDLDKNGVINLREELGAREDQVVVIGIGRLEKEKNFSCLVDAIAKVDKQLPVQTWIVGDGSQKQALQELIGSHDLASKVKLLGYRNDVPRLLAGADIFVLASKKEPFGMSAVEAMVAQLPVVATIGPGLSTIVSDGKTGLLIPPDDSIQLAAAITKLINDSDLRRQLAQAGRERAEQLFTSDLMAKKIVQVYDQVLAAHRPNASATSL